MKLLELDRNKFGRFICTFGSESDRGAVVLAGSYIENLLGLGLQTKIVSDNKSLIKDLFSSNGALSTFSQRVSICEAFGYLSPEICGQITAIRHIRNHFAHHPFDAKFDDAVIRKHMVKLIAGKWYECDATTSGRLCYLSTCGYVISVISRDLNVSVF